MAFCHNLIFNSGMENYKFIKKFLICFMVASIVNTGFFSHAYAKKFWKFKTEKRQEQSSETKNDSRNKLFDLNRSLEPFSMSIMSDQQKEPSLPPIQAVVENDNEAADELELKSETVDFYPETRQYIAKGNSELIIKNQKVRLSANEIIIDQKNYSIIGIGNVKIIKGTDEYFGDYIKIDTKKESSFLTRPIFYFDEMTVIAKTASMYASNTFLKDGDAIVNKKALMLVQTTGFGGVESSRFFDVKKFKEGTNDKYRIVAKKIIVKREKEKSSIHLTGVNIYLGKVKIAYAPHLIIEADKDVKYVETTVPELGNKGKLGNFIAPSVVLGLPGATTLKAGPLLTLKDSAFGIGAFARLSNPRGRFESYYSGSTNKFVLNGRYKLADNVYLHYVLNDYIDGGWMGGAMPYYGLELAYDKDTSIPQANTWIRNKVSAGFFKDNEDYEVQHSTARYRWLADATNLDPLFGWKNYLMFGYRYQHDLSLYQTGDLVGVARIGPRIYSDLGRLFLEANYFASGEYGESPFIFDRYRYGKNNVTVRGQWYVNKFLSLGYYGSLNLSGRDYDDNWLSENQFICAIGSDDIKLRFGFDTIRNSTTVGLDLLLGSNKTLVEFDEMKVQDFDRTNDGKKKKEDRKKLKKQKQMQKLQKQQQKQQQHKKEQKV